MTSRVVHPVSGNDADLIVESTSERQHLDIKSPSFDLCVGEEPLRRLSAKGLESALGIPNTRNSEKLHNEITNPSCPALIPWLGNRLFGVRSVFRCGISRTISRSTSRVLSDGPSSIIKISYAKPVAVRYSLNLLNVFGSLSASL